MQRCVPDGGSAHEDRRHVGDRGQGTGATDIHLDLLELGRHLLRRELVRRRPPRRPRHEPQCLLLLDAVDLDDDPVGLVVEVLACLRPLVDVLDHRVGPIHAPGVRVDRETQPAHELERRRVRREPRHAHDLVGPDR